MHTKTGAAELQTLTLDQVSLQDEASFRHVGFYGDLKRRL